MLGLSLALNRAGETSGSTHRQTGHLRGRSRSLVKRDGTRPRVATSHAARTDGPALACRVSRASCVPARWGSRELVSGGGGHRGSRYPAGLGVVEGVVPAG